MTDEASEATARLIDPSFLFRFELEIPHVPLQWKAAGVSLPESCRLPDLGQLGEHPSFADVRIGWDETGIGIAVIVSGKSSVPWCRETRLEDSDGVHLWIDTRCSPNIHRATGFCHRFLFMPAGGGPSRDKPVASLVPIQRARANPKPIKPGSLKVMAIARHDGYKLSGFIPAAAMTGFDPSSQSRLGFFCSVVDRELGWQTLSLGPEYPVADDPSLWCQAVLKQGE
ncbi:MULTISPECIES: hypothetical protein [Crateriforma]|uniref:Carbohydrate-binding domain-containing protein n=1 Tax=Crateriforma conspicua TaxID=2527996 RepID=A0A5C6FUH3_9PLAN|nr:MULTISPECIES: hypothetical protein [Crateriforma]TWU66712.1 hypothetical protein V7x_22830 [Crateriforma conspicua]